MTSSRDALTDELSEKCDRLLACFSPEQRVAVALSGGVDSAVVAQAAHAATGDASLAVTAVSPSLASGELDVARQVAAQIGIRHHVISTGEFEVPGYMANAGNRCYFCKSTLYERLLELAGELGFDAIANGTNCDDLGDHRPGLVAAEENRVRSPLVEAGLRKADVRALAQHWGLPIWDKPASPCLSSRIAYGVEVTPERTRRVDAAESFLKQRLGVRELRVRLEAGELARIELPPEHLAALAERALIRTIVVRLKELGFRYVTLDLEGFRSGSMNDVLPIEQLQRFDR